MVEGTLEGPVDARSAQRFWRLTGGNALFLQQLLKDQIAAGRVRQVAGVWMWDGDVAVSQTMSDLVGNQLDRLPPELATVVDALSQCEPLRVDVLADLVRREDLETAEQMTPDHRRTHRAVSCSPAWRTHCSANCAVRPPVRCTCRRCAVNWRSGSARRRPPIAIRRPRCGARC